MPATAPHPDRRLTHDDFVLFPDDGKRHEIIDGEHYVTPSPNVRHQRLVRRLLLSIGQYLEAHPTTGEVFGSPLDVVLSFHDVVEPDPLFIADRQSGILTEENVQGPPTLVVEVLSNSTRKKDAQTKRRLFERTGVREYWLSTQNSTWYRCCAAPPPAASRVSRKSAPRTTASSRRRCCLAGSCRCACCSPSRRSCVGAACACHYDARHHEQDAPAR